MTMSTLSDPAAVAGTAIALYARRSPQLASRIDVARTLLRDAADAFAGSIVLSTSLGVEDMVLADLIARDGLDIPLATLDTGALHPETLELIDRLRGHYGIAVEVWRPDAEQVMAFVAREGELAMRRSVELRHACCALRKLEPLGRMLDGRRAWVTGLRREQSQQRGAVEPRALDAAGRTKFSPLADWSLADVWQYVADHGVPYNPLHDAHVPSIGCAPCTRAVAVGEDFRAGRWWWEQDQARECGLHVEPNTKTS